MLVGAENESSQKSNSSDLGLITLRVKPHLAKLSSFMDEQIGEFEAEIQDMVAFCLKNSGKRLRPILLFYSGWQSENVVLKDLVKAAAVIEFVHLATLVHDDVLDGATLRHNDLTVSKKYGSKVAILLGDALFSHALKLASEFPIVDVSRAVATSTRRVCSGEIIQTFQRGNPSIKVGDYYRVIELKTAELFYVASFLGAKLAGYEVDFIKAAGTYGKHLGIAYQIYDDLADFVEREERTGKTLGTDIANQEVTLPVLLLLKRLDKGRRNDLIKMLQSGQKVDLGVIRNLLADYGVFKEANALFRRELDFAESALAPFLKHPPVKFLSEISNWVADFGEKSLFGH
ncbi:MAG: Heptaprenyl diphosphate synthase component 2 [Candidatus Moanabacter tarae]|uniref:Heptaprenyl diphosphate synthase component 2 n=1 Tax=Candidatus Moanibacter tarae TaxID=2200854 RepID=A0A2Z4AD81_9BACT|nr:MAG: Heptaprenyl diphosphate synthase component 2 [Candidatus Moanabacter tarae]|tara:strand:- start:13708 stop:14742 length:1035 start_codon:yes stop_codon:yes gene_type:complete